MYKPQFSLSMPNIIGVTPTSKTSMPQRRSCQIKMFKNDDEGNRCIPWIPEGKVCISEDSVIGIEERIEGFGRRSGLR